MFPSKLNITTLRVMLLFFLISTFSFSQNEYELIKKQAIAQMDNGRYWEAIELLNRYVSAKPQVPDGYHLRGLCYEKREQYEWSVYDLRAARKLAPNNSEINKDLGRVTATWYSILRNKIVGHKREIAIDPRVAVNYLEIGKSHKHMGEWIEAEWWYDEYLKREEPSSDEVIRYTEILARNGHIQKGEPILKRFSEKYPKDHRIWSRYGYFTMWLGKIKIAIYAFEQALYHRPFFKEAQDGLDMARGKPYTYTYYDTLARYKQEQQKQQEYIIDKYYRVLKSNPSDDETRFLLIEELLKVERFEEAYQQVQILFEKYQGEERYEELSSRVYSIRDSVYNERAVALREKVKTNPGDRESVLLLAAVLGNLRNYDEAILILEEYLKAVPNESDIEIRFTLANYYAWNRQFPEAIELSDWLLTRSPENLKYQLLRAQLAVWVREDLVLARGYLENILKKDINNIEALIAMGSLELHELNYDAAEQYAQMAKQLDPKNGAVDVLLTNISSQRSRAEEERIFEILQKAREIVGESGCASALSKYEEYLSQTTPSRYVRKEYADILACAGNYSDALQIYNELLDESYDFDIVVQRAKTYFMADDSLMAVQEFDALYKEYPNNRDIKLLLADSYSKADQFDDARELYDELLESTEDTAEIAVLKQRLDWLPVSGFRGFLATFPSYLGISPTFNYYKDNIDFRFYTYGLRMEFGIFGPFAGGINFTRTHYEYTSTFRDITSIKWMLYYRPNPRLTIYGGIGSLNTLNSPKRTIYELQARYEIPKKYFIAGSFERSDARAILNAPRLLSQEFLADIYRVTAFYQLRPDLKASLYFGRIIVSDGNKGNDFQLRIGKQFFEDLYIGYEYAASKFARGSLLYYSPLNFLSHSAWFEWIAEKNEIYNVNVGGKLGYIPDGDFIIRELYVDGNYIFFSNLSLSARVSYGSTYRFTIGYESFSAYVTLFWNIF